MNNISAEEKEPSIIERKEMQKFIKNREIKPEDFYLIEKLAAFPVNMIILELHNFFNMSRENSKEELRRTIERSRDRDSSGEKLSIYRGASRTELLETALKFCEKYDWAVSWNLVRVLEEI